MAESVAYYLENPDKLKTVSMRKFEFIRDRVMHGTMYVAQIREDLTFTVYNLFPDYTYPGKVTKVEVSVVGAPEEDKEVTIKVTLHSSNPELDGASLGYLRFASILGTIHDSYLMPENGIMDSVLIAKTTFSKYEKSGYWSLASLMIKDKVGNERYENTSTVGMKLYIENPLEDVTPPRWNYDLMMEVVNGKFSGDFDVRPDENGVEMQAIKVTSSFYDKIPTARTLSRVILASSTNAEYERYSHDIQSGQPYNSEGQLENGYNSNKYFVTYLGVREYLQTGYYSITFTGASDIGGNGSMVYFVNDTSDFHISPLSKNSTFKDVRDSIYVYTKYPDYLKPEMDINNISINAEPTNPVSPDGETRVDIRVLARDLSDYAGHESGIFSINITLRDPLGREYNYQPQCDRPIFNAIPDNTSEWKIFNLDLLLPKGSPPGKWGISAASLMDRAGNRRNYSFVEYVRFDVTLSDIVLEEPLAIEITDKLVNADNVDKIDISIRCKPSIGLNYVYTIYSLMGGHVVRGEGTMTSDIMIIKGINTVGVLDGIIHLTVQLIDTGSQLIATKTVEYDKDTQRPSAYYTRSNLQNNGQSNLDDIVFEIVFDQSEVGGTYEFSIEDLTTNLKSTLNSDTIFGTINSDIISLSHIDLSKYRDKVIKTSLIVTDTCLNKGDYIYNYFLIIGDSIIQIELNTDTDGDGVSDINDNSPNFYNPNQEITGISDLENFDFIKIYPNPTRNQLYINVEETGTIFIYDVFGRLVIQKSISKYLEDIDVSELSSGTYLLKFYTESTNKTLKFIKE